MSSNIEEIINSYTYNINEYELRTLFKNNMIRFAHYSLKSIAYLFGEYDSVNNVITLNNLVTEEDIQLNKLIFDKPCLYNYLNVKNTTNTFCWNCKNCTNCKYCVDCVKCVECTECSRCNDCFNTLNCIDSKELITCTDCDKCFKCVNCEICTNTQESYDCIYLIDCEHCNNCVKCMKTKLAVNSKFLRKCYYCTDCDGCMNCMKCFECEDCCYCFECERSIRSCYCLYSSKLSDCKYIGYAYSIENIDVIALYDLYTCKLFADDLMTINLNIDGSYMKFKEITNHLCFGHIYNRYDEIIFTGILVYSFNYFSMPITNVYIIYGTLFKNDHSYIIGMICKEFTGKSIKNYISGKLYNSKGDIELDIQVNEGFTKIFENLL